MGSEDAWTVEEELTGAEVSFLDAEMYRLNVERTGIADGRMLSITRRDGRDIVAAIHGHTWGGVLEIKVLWVHAGLRGKGYGRRLLAAAEHEGRRRGCTQALLCTHSFQAPDFYVKFGYELFATLPDYPAGYAQHFFRKSLETND